MSYVDSMKKPQQTMFEPFAEFCESTSTPVLIVPAGFDLSPPQLNANDGDEVEDVATVLEDSTATVIIDDENDSWG
jgi:hypothetical protein